jgi:hypothetical protein
MLNSKKVTLYDDYTSQAEGKTVVAEAWDLAENVTRFRL